MSIALPYFRYLRDVSRRIVQKSGFDNVFKGTAANPDCISLLTERRGQQWFRDAKKEADKADKQLFLGIGAIIGSARTRGRPKKVAAPLFYVISELDADHSKLRLKRDTIIPNYDLIQHLIGFELESGEEEDQYAKINPSIQNLWLQLDRVTDIIGKLPLPEIIGSEKIEDLSTVFQATIQQFISDLCLTNPSLRIAAVPNARTVGDLKARVRQQTLCYSTDCFVFSAHFPDQLSTYSALQSLISQLENGEAENELISRMVGNALRIPDMRLEDVDIDREAIRQAIKYVPFTLSSSQKAAIYNAWTSEVSYIQGPPGTGKSHTIAALMLTALFMGKKVLLVSQKKAAVNVVREKLSKLAAGSDLLMFISKDSEIKTSLRRDLDGIIQQSHQDRTHQALEETRRKHAQLLARVNQSREKLAELRGKIKKMISLQRDQYLANTDFLYSRSQLTNTFQTINPEFTFIEDMSARSWEKRVTKLHSISLLPPIVKQDALYLKTSKSFAKRILKADENLLDVRRPQFPLYVQQLVACNLAFSTEQNFRKATEEADDINAFRRLYDDELKSLSALQERLVASTAELRKRELLASSGEQDNLRKFNGMLWNTDPNLIEPQMESIDYDHLTSAFPLWAGLIRDLGNYIPFKPGLFDLVIVDESSQVNTAEVLPAFYRGRRACVVGDKNQLGLNAAGLFSLNRRYEEMCWNNHFSQSYSFDKAQNQGVVVSKNSILEFVTNPNSWYQPPSATLNEHFRSAPKLAEFTSNHFYKNEGGLKIMTMVAEKVTLPCFKAIHVDSNREENSRVVVAEVEACVSLLRELIDRKSWSSDPLLKGHFKDGKTPTIGVLCFTTQQVAEVKERVEAVFGTIGSEYDFLCGTTEEFQGNEKNIMILLPASDNLLTSYGFYNDAKRMNVATSRAINFTYLIYGGLPDKFTSLRSYIRHFDLSEGDINDPVQLVEKYYHWTHQWRFDDDAIESEFERNFYGYLISFLQREYSLHDLRIFNQVPSCGKRIDFVVFNPQTSRAFAIEVDGPTHYDQGGTNFTEDHIEREELLKRAGWSILHIPYYQWYHHGWLATSNPSVFQRYASRLNVELRRFLDSTFSEHSPLKTQSG